MKNKYAFTLAELLVVFVIMGILIIISLHTMNNRFVDFFTRYYAAYDALSKAAYNTYTDTYCRVKGAASEDRTDCQPQGEDGEDHTADGRPFPKTPNGLCKRLTEYLNATAETEDCSESILPIKDAIEEEFNKDTLQFALTNGFRFYFSEFKETSINHAGSRNKNVKYFIVYVDLNNTAPPNRVYLPHPDIVPFIVTTTGDVIPVGYPVYDKTYASARIIDSMGKQTISYTMDEARQIAFGNTPYVDMPITMMPVFNNLLPSKARPTGTHPTYPLGGDSSNTLNCEQGTFNCALKIDENLEKRY